MQNYGLTIYLSENDKTDLKYILQIVGERGKQAVWKVSDVECIGKSDEILHRFSDKAKEISGEVFYNIISDIHQILDGTFIAYKTGELSHWLLIRSIRGDEFDIETKDLELLERIRNSFHNVKDLIY